MCGIIGINSKYPIKKNLIKCLENLEYRGYDSVGIYLNQLIKTIGRVSDLKKKIPDSLDEKIGIGHSRWATHGKVNDENAHPFISFNKKIVLVHNGIINNYLDLKEKLLNVGYVFNSDTDSEVVANLIDYYYSQNKNTLEALKLTLSEIKGTYALCFMNLNEDNIIYFAKKESPLIIGLGNDFNFVVSDINSSYFLTNKFIILNDDEYGYIKNDEYKVYKNNELINKAIIDIDIKDKGISKHNFEHFMIKEIYDEPKVLKKILDTYTSNNKINISNNLINDLKNSDEINIIGCGTSYHAGLIGKYVIETLVNKKVNVYLASEFSNITIKNDGVYLFLSQSGETIDLKLAYNLIENKDKIYTFTNVLTSSLALLAKETFDLCSDIEIAVASTKAYISEVTLLIMLAYKMINKDQEFIDNIYKCINSINSTLLMKDIIYNLAFKIKDSSSLFFLGKGIDHYINLESSLKLKEVSYIHSEAMFSGELKHGSIALISENTNVIGLITNPRNTSSFLNNLKEVEARKSNIYLVTTSNVNNKSDYIINCDNALFSSICVAPFFQLLSYYTAKLNNRDIDKPRNLAKSCTVE